jgi:hypothetical protein
MPAMTTRRASCSCGQLHLETTGEPVRVSVCHCLECQKRTGSAFAAQARFHRDQIKGPEGRATTFTRVGDSGGACVFSFCPVCGSSVFYTADGADPPYTKDFLAVTLGSFADPTFPTPTVSVYEERKHPWVKVLEGTDAEHYD